MPRIPEEGTHGLLDVDGVRDGNMGGGLASLHPFLFPGCRRIGAAAAFQKLCLGAVCGAASGAAAAFHKASFFTFYFDLLLTLCFVMLDKSSSLCLTPLMYLAGML